MYPLRDISRQERVLKVIRGNCIIGRKDELHRIRYLNSSSSPARTLRVRHHRFSLRKRHRSLTDSTPNDCS